MNNQTEINKPISVAKEDFATALVKLCNESQMPLFVIEYTLKDLLQEVHTLAKQQYEVDKQQYEQAVAALKTENKTECETR